MSNYFAPQVAHRKAEQKHLEHKRQLELAERELERAKKMREGKMSGSDAKLGGGGYGLKMLSSPSAPSKANVKVTFAEDVFGENGKADESDVKLELELPRSALKQSSEHV